MTARNQPPTTRLMQKFSSNYKKQTLILFLSYATIAIVATVFYSLQNTAVLSGGNIALAKVVWLAYTILLWFVLPAILILDPKTPDKWKTAYQVFLANMLFRAVVELLMIYTWLNWNIAYGIAHDVFSIALLSGLILKNRKYLYDLFSSILVVFLFMFVVEIIFVLYMASNIPEAGSSVYFVPDNSEHQQIILITWAVNLLITVYLYYFSRAWIHEKKTS